MSRAFKTWNALKGILCIYKPPEVPLMTVAPKIEKNLLHDLNQSFLPISMKYPQKYSSHPRVIGREFYDADDLTIHFLTDDPREDPRYSGLVLVAINENEEEVILPKMDQRYYLDLKFGVNTDTGFLREGVKILKRTSLPKPGALEKAVRSTLFSLGQNDVLRARIKSFNGHEATLDIITKPLPGNALFLHFKDKLAQRIRSGVSIVRVRRYGIGPFTTENALLHKQWNLKEISQNIQVNRDLLNGQIEKAKSLSED